MHNVSLSFMIACGLAMLVWPQSAPGQSATSGSPLLTVRSSATATLGEGTKAQVKEKARLEAIRKAIELYAGVTITAQSTVRNWELQEDVVQSYNRAYVKSVREISYVYDSATETGRYEGEFVLDTAATATMAEAERALAASRARPVEAAVFLFDGEGRMIADGAAVRPGERFHVMVQPAGDLYAYLIARDSGGNLFRIFPNPDVASLTNPLRAGSQYTFPPRDSDLVFAFDEQPGRERFYFLFSAVPLADLDALFARLEELKDAGDEAGQATLAPIIQERVASRGMVLQSKSTRADVRLSDSKTEQRVGELLRGTGAFVKSIGLVHVR